MKRKELIKKYLDFFKEKDHKIIASASLVPENDPTVLFTTAGMQPLVPFLAGQKHPLGKRLVGVQKCIRTGDIEEVGNATHHTFFEMLGNWSLGDYDKTDSIKYSFEFLTKILKIQKKELSVTCFKGDKDAPKDTEAQKTWKELGIEKITFLGKKDNWWGPAGTTGPCGPDTEIFYWRLNNKPIPKEFIPNDSTLATSGEEWVEIWNNVFMEYTKDKKGNYNPAKQKNIDTGMGLERTLAILNNLDDNYLTEIWQPLIKKIEKLSSKKYEKNKKEMRIVADHIKAASFIISDGVVPSNTEQGYVLRKLIRRAIRNLRELEIDILRIDTTVEIAKEIFKIYPDYNLNEKIILTELKKEEDKFQKTLDKGLKEFKKMSQNKIISGKESFLLFQSYGFPVEMIAELSEENKIKFDQKGFYKELKKHQELSRTASSGKFKSGLSDSSVATTKLHTVAHLLLAALRIVLGKEVSQKGSNITAERLRLDFSYDKKMTPEEITKVERLVNEQIKNTTQIFREEMSPKEAKEQGALGNFSHKYGQVVSVYTIGNFSKEICTGPHVKNTKELETFKIKKESSSSSGVRRIKAILE